MAALRCPLSRSAVPLAAAQSLCTGVPDTPRPFNLPSTASQHRLAVPGPSFLPLLPPKAGSLVVLRRPALGLFSKRSFSVIEAAGSSNWTRAFRLGSLFDKFSQNPSEILLQSIVAGPPSEVVPFVFAEVSNLDNDCFYPPYFLELLVSWQAHSTEFEAVFWKTLKQQVTGTNDLRGFVGHFLTDRKTSAGGLTGSQLGRRFEGAFLDEGRLNPVTHQLDGLSDVLRRMGHIEYMEHDSQRYEKLRKRFAAARDRNAAAALRVGSRFPREEPPWRATPAQDVEVRPVALLEAAPPEDASRVDPEEEVPTEGAVPSDGSDQSTSENLPVVLSQQRVRGEVPTGVGHPVDVVPFVFGEASDLDNERHFKPLMKEVLMSWYAFPESFEDVFWKIMKQQTTGTYNLRDFLAFFLTDRGVSVGNLTGAELQARLRPRFLEEARFGPVTHQLDGLDRILQKLGLASYSANRASGSEWEDDFKALSALGDQFRLVRSKNVAETQALEERFPREVPPWRSVLPPETTASG